MVGIKDVAKRAGVSVGAVSLALNNKKGVSEETRERIIAIAEEMKYKHSFRVTKTTSEKTYKIRLIVVARNMVVSQNAQTQPFFSTLINNILSLSNHKSILISLSTVNHEEFLSYMNRLDSESEIDGVILLSTDLEENDLIKTVNSIKFPTVLLDSSHNLLDLNQIGINNEQGASLVADFIYDKGYKKIGYAMSNSRINNFKQRQIAFTNRLKYHNKTVSKDFIYNFSPNSLDLNDEVKNQILSTNSLPDVIFCENDSIAISLIKTLNSLNYNIPEDVSIIGFDDIPEATIISPELTTISVDKANFAQLAINQLIFSINHKYSYQTLLSCKLIERGSTG